MKAGYSSKSQSRSSEYESTSNMPTQSKAKIAASLPSTQRTAARLFEDLQQILDELATYERRNELIREVDSAILQSTFSAQDVLDLIIRKCLSLTHSRHGQVVIYNQNRLIVTASSEPTRIDEELLLHRSLCGKAILERSDQLCPDVSALPKNSYVRYHDETKSEFVFLIQPGYGGRILGVLALERDTLGPLPETAKDFATLLAAQAAIAIEQARTWSGVKTLYDISTALVAGTVTLEQSCQTILNSLLQTFDFEHGQILGCEGNELVIIASSRQEDIGLRPGANSSVCGRYLLTEGGREIKVIDDITESEYWDSYLNLLGLGDERMLSEIIVPLIDDSGQLSGALNIESPQRGSFSDFDVSIFGVVGRLLAGAISAAIASRKRAKEDQIRTANLAMAHLGNVAQSFVHRFGNQLGDARGRMIELKQHLDRHDLPKMRKDTMDIGAFIGDILENLGEARDVVDNFSKQFNPSLGGFQYRNISLADVGKELLEKFRRKYADKGIIFQFEDSLPSVKKNGQPSVGSRAICRLTDQVYDVVENLLNNSVRAVLDRPSIESPGQVVVTASLSSALYAGLQVKDNGKGIREQDQRRIFEFGYSTQRDKGKSLGIGLWFCEHYAFQLGGKITFESEEGKGASFKIEFPTVGNDILS